MPSFSLFTKLLENNYFRNCPVTPEDAKRASKIWGEDSFNAQGKTTRPQAHRITLKVPNEEIQTIVNRHPYTNLAMDYIFVLGIAFLHTLPIEYKFGTIKRKSPKYNDILQGIRKAMLLYEKRGIKVLQVVRDNEFECVREDIRSTQLTTVSRNEHVGPIERRNQTLKERVRSLIHMTPYDTFCTLLIIGVVTKAT